MEKEIPDVKVNFWNRITLREKAVFYEHLSNLVDGWVTLIEAIESFCEKVNNPLFFREVSQLLLLIDSGDVMSTAMKKLPRVFNKAEVSIVEAGEQSGTMHRSFESLAGDLRNQEELRKKVISALTYPAIILVFLLAAIIIVMVFVIPKLLPLFETTQTELPLSTSSLIATSNFISNHLFLLMFATFLLVLWSYGYSQSYSGKRFFDELLLKFPLIGTVYRNYMIVRISTTLGLLLGAGIPILKTLKLTGESTNNVVYEELMGRVVQSVSQGNKIAESFIETDPSKKYFTQDFIQLISAAERTSTINKICIKISAQYTREVDTALTTLVKYVEPTAILISGVFVVWFAFAIFSAVLKITETVG